ncbi:hypothetical protein B1218_34330 [Pseudomonas ogarae]|nr:hypothetical protein B1218_34330 [Pseudomonas ogarae]
MNQSAVTQALDARSEVVYGEGMILTTGGYHTPLPFSYPQQIGEALMSGVTTMLGGGTGAAGAGGARAATSAASVGGGRCLLGAGHRCVSGECFQPVGAVPHPCDALTGLLEDVREEDDAAPHTFTRCPTTGEEPVPHRRRRSRQ